MIDNKTVKAHFKVIIAWIAAHLVLAIPFWNIMTSKQWVEAFINLGSQLMLFYGGIYVILRFCHKKEALKSLASTSNLECIDAFWLIENSFRFQRAILLAIFCLATYTATTMLMDHYIWGYRYNHITIHIDRRLLMRGLPYAMMAYGFAFWLSYRKSRRVVSKLYADKILDVSHINKMLELDNKLLETSNKNLKELNMTALIDDLLV